MPDVIRLLPDSVANQIAAGEVIQRPSSAIKELLENSIDAGALDIKVIIKDAGKTLLQVVDDGCGMSETDARLSFERHATSKIREANDLFNITTLGFRGEALASIASVSQLELKTKRTEDSLGIRIEMEATELKRQEYCSCPDGTSISVKNLFYNVPARRRFLKSDHVEFRHILDEFHRIALAFPRVAFSLFHNGKQVYMLPAASLKQRIVSLFGSQYNSRLLPVEQKTSLANITGFIVKPEFVKKHRGDQFFFTNGRFIRHPYLNHSVESAYRELIPEDAFPAYFIFLQIDPRNIDVNIHPTKTEINFLEAQHLYALLRSAIKETLGKFTLTPVIDFDIEKGLDIEPLPRGARIRPPGITVNPDYNPFDIQTGRAPRQEYRKPEHPNRDWEKLFRTDTGLKGSQDQHGGQDAGPPVEDRETLMPDEEDLTGDAILQIRNRYLVTRLKSGLVIIDKAGAYRRIYFERYLEMLQNRKPAGQKLLFPVTLHLSPSDAELVRSMLDDINALGYEIGEFGRDTLIVNGVPAGASTTEVGRDLEIVIGHFRNNPDDPGLDKKINLARSMAAGMATRMNRPLQTEEATSLIGELFHCKVPDTDPEGRPTLVLVSFGELEKKFKRTGE
jgi:DNA mismatch repair protein MutL